MRLNTGCSPSLAGRRGNPNAATAPRATPAGEVKMHSRAWWRAGRSRSPSTRSGRRPARPSSPSRKWARPEPREDGNRAGAGRPGPGHKLAGGPTRGGTVPEKIGRGPLAATLEEVVDGVWLLRGDAKRGMNIYFLRDGDGVTQFDAGTQPMTAAARTAAERLGGLRRIVLGHADSDHRGSAPHLGAPIFCHPGEL